jgi:hypothetical protein
LALVEDHGIRMRPSGEKVMRHSKLGTIRVTFATFQANDDPRLTLVVYGLPDRYTALMDGRRIPRGREWTRARLYEARRRE